MQKIDTTSSRALDPASSDWNFIEVWIDPMLSPPYVLLLLGEPSGSCHVCDPAEGYKVVYGSVTYDDAQTWLLEDKYSVSCSRKVQTRGSNPCSVLSHLYLIQSRTAI